jgi:hypothetical protein
MPPEPVHDTARSTICATFDEYIATLPRWERDLLVYVAENFCHDSSSYELLQQSNAKILIASDGGHEDDYGSFGGRNAT